MASRYVQLDGQAFEAFLAGRGFAREVKGSEIVYVKTHERCQHLFVKVYSSISSGTTVGRGCGQDAVRIIAFFDNGQKSFGLFKARVYRTGSQNGIEERTLTHMRSAYARCNEWLKNNYVK